jgi:nondiscriminating glutamyl-tRNA synthetase
MIMIQKNIRTRIAPSPTGPLHLGTARTALFNYLFAKKNKGKFILRIEDTDLERSDPKWEKDIIDNLKWLGIEWDEGPDIGGKYSPYRQSERIADYANYIEKLLQEDKAYYCFCSEEELEAQRQEQMTRGAAPKYSGKCRQLSKEQTQKWLGEGRDAIIRFKTPAKKIKFRDLIKGEIEFDSGLIGDFAIAKDVSTPLYNFAVVIDDFEMKITHVIRGEDHLSNTPKQILLLETLGFPKPEYAHLPLILGPDRSKLSKRHGAVAISQYRKEGYLPEALINFMAFLGWNPGTEREVFSLPSLIKEFSLEKVQKSGAIFNIKRLDYLNGFYIRQKSPDKLTELSVPFLIEAGLITQTPQPVKISRPPGIKLMKVYQVEKTKEKIDFDLLKKIIGIYQERLKKLSEIADLTDFFFLDRLNYEKNLLSWKDMSNKEIEESLDKIEKILSKIDRGSFNKENLEKELLPEAEKTGDRGKLLWPFRVALTGKKASAGPFEIAEILGKEKTLKRIKEAKDLLK